MELKYLQVLNLIGMRLSFFLISFFFISVGSGQTLNFQFDNISARQNLSHNTCISVLRDSKGFLWIATVDGLNRYDGYSCKVYKHDPKDSNSISVNFIHGIYEDSKERLWITTRDGGLNLFDYKTEKFTHYLHNALDSGSISSNVINSIVEINNNKFLIGTDNGLNIFTPDTGKFKRIFNDPDNLNSLSNNWVNFILKTSDGTIWISTNNGLNIYDPESQTFRRYYHSKGGLSHSFTTSLYEDTDGTIWIGTKGGVLNNYNPHTGIFNEYSSQMRNSLGSLPISINSVISYDSEHLLIATEGAGVILFNKNDLTFKANKHDPNNSASVSSDIVVNLYKDKQGIIWLTTWGGGVDKLTPKKRNFNLYQLNNIKNSRKTVSNSIFAIIKDKEDHVWLGTKGRRLVSFDLKTNKAKEIKLPHDKDSYNSGIGALCLDSKDNLWVAYEGLVKFNLHDAVFTVFQHDTIYRNSLSSNNIKCIVETKDGNIWVGTEDKGASRLDPEQNLWTRYFDHPDNPVLVRTIHEDPFGNIWMGTYKHGIIKLDPSTGDTTTYLYDPANPFSLSNNDVRHITSTGDSIIWIATYGGGINYFDRSMNRFYSIKEEDGLSNNFTYGILEDYAGDLWISTNYGLNRYNRYTKEIRHFTEEDGLQNDEFNTGAFYKFGQDQLLFGGVNGFNSFYPDKIVESTYSPPIFLTSFKVFDKELSLDSAIAFKKKLLLSHADKFFSVEFSALDFTSPAKHNYAYMLEGFDKEWIYSGGRRFASYTNLDPGQYTIKVKASSIDDVWSGEEALLNVIVTPPYWRTTWFISLITLATVTLFILIIRYYSTRKLKEQIRILEKEQLVQRERERISRDLHDNVGAQLTFLVSSIDNLTYSRESSGLIERIADISNYGRKTIKELRNTIWAMKHNDTDLQELILKINELKQEINASFGNGYFSIKNDIVTPLKLNVTQAINIYRIIQEALQNVIKHGEASRIELIFFETKEDFKFSIYDNGKGFDTEGKSTGNGLLNMRGRCKEVNGKFDLSSGSEGTIITCTFEK